MFISSSLRWLIGPHNLAVTAAAVLVLLASPAALTQQHSTLAEAAQLGHHLQPRLGRTVDNVADSIVSPDGSALPEGSGTAAIGEGVYRARCSACHGPVGAQKGNSLVGGIGSLATGKPFKSIGSYWPYATTLFDYIARAMPYGQEKSLTANEVYALTAYLLHLNGIVGAQQVVDKDRLPVISMPNRDGFIELHR